MRLDLIYPLLPARLASGGPVVPETIWFTWSWDPLVLLGLILAGGLYGQGVLTVWRRAGAGRVVGFGRVIAFFAGLLTLFVALVSPVDALGEALLVGHMVQHLLLILVAAPLLVVGATRPALAWALPPPARRDIARWWHRQRALGRLWHGLSHPGAVWLIQAAAILLWHLPRFYQAAVRSEFVHILEHASFFGAALLFWWVVARSDRLALGTTLFLLFTTALYNGLLGALLTFAGRPWYPVYNVTAYAWGLSPLEDQQLAGVIMWFPAGLFYLGALLLLLGGWLHRQETGGNGRPRVARPPARAGT